MASFRIDRISEEVRTAVDNAIRGMNDPAGEDFFEINQLRHAGFHGPGFPDDGELGRAQISIRKYLLWNQ